MKTADWIKAYYLGLGWLPCNERQIIKQAKALGVKINHHVARNLHRLACFKTVIDGLYEDHLRSLILGHAGRL